MESSRGTNRRPSTNSNLLNTQAFTCYTFPEWFVLEVAPTAKRMDDAQRVLRINRTTG